MCSYTKISSVHLLHMKWTELSSSQLPVYVILTPKARSDIHLSFQLQMLSFMPKLSIHQRIPGTVFQSVMVVIWSSVLFRLISSSFEVSGMDHFTYHYLPHKFKHPTS